MYVRLTRTFLKNKHKILIHLVYNNYRFKIDRLCSIMRARACIRCKEYIVIHPNNPVNQNKIELFEKKHHLHTLITVDIDEI